MTSMRSTFAIWGLRSGVSQHAKSTQILLCVFASMVAAGCQKDPVPVDIRKMAAVEFPDDNKIHVQSLGRITISPKTEICHFRDSFGMDGAILRKVLADNGQSPNLPSGRIRTNGVIGVSPECEQADTVNFYGYQATNRNGEPYKLVYLIWQKSAAWIGIIERKDGVRPGLDIPPVGATVFPGPINDRRLLEKSRAADFNELGQAFLVDAFRSQK